MCITITNQQRYGPFTVTKVVSPNAYQLQLPPSMKLHPVFHTVRLRPYVADSIPGRLPPSRPPPTVDGEAAEWEVESIRDSRLKRGVLQYLVKWKGYPHEESTWEPASHLKHAAEVVRDFHLRHPSAPRKISALTFSRLPFKAYQNLTEITPLRKLYDWSEGKHIEGNVP